MIPRSLVTEWNGGSGVLGYGGAWQGAVSFGLAVKAGNEQARLVQYWRGGRGQDCRDRVVHGTVGRGLAGRLRTVGSGDVWRAAVWSGGQGAHWSGGASSGTVRHGMSRRSRSGTIRRGAELSGLAVKVMRGVLRRGAVSLGKSVEARRDADSPVMAGRGGQGTSGPGSSGRGAARRSRKFWSADARSVLAVKTGLGIAGRPLESQRKQGREGFGPPLSSHD